MKSDEALRVLAEVTASQWGLVTSAQAGARGVSRLDLSRLTQAGHLDRLTHGVYRDAGTPADRFEDLRAAWLSTEPATLGETRLRDRAAGVVVAGASAARLHEIGDLWADRHEFVAPTRRQSQRPEIRYRQRSLDPRDVTQVQGLPAMTIERTIADLVEDVGDLSLASGALGDAVTRRPLDLERLRALLAPLAERNGLRRHDGDALLARLLEIAGVDVETVAGRIAADPVLGPRVTAKYLGGLTQEELAQMTAPELQESLAQWLPSESLPI
ncbi:type IV toxin-antitoxin system AbiEi family antitoxin domain-containing protein [Granulicoccus phenolivorans]|uniref:type IV toxin-antitoxin system AbiEi family antitoxin domain-containing protein n=1 Tax=Granulicoccus phenolivorans TaxID=266854 RepID=UPI000688E5E3|nr:type IV toxin-antitoxin system AbiEi family antitoxin domain-containing protein [Granulicoccus phenolivorans]